MSPLDIACRHQSQDLTNCGASAGETCRGLGIDQHFHAERIEDAACMSGEAQAIEIPNAVIDRAVDEMGIA